MTLESGRIVPSGSSTAEDSRQETGAESDRLAALGRYDILDTPREEAFDRVTRLAQRIFHVPISAVSLVDGHRQWFKAQCGLDADETPRGPAFCAVTAARRTPLIVVDASQDPAFAANPFVTGEPHIRFYAGAPLITSDGHAIGAFCVIDREPREFDAGDLAILRDLAAVVMDELELRRLANEDGLTGALSRRAFREEAARSLALAARHGHEVSLALIDLDHFKAVNDAHGHAAGDAVLKRCVAACVGELRGSDLIGRLGGEEFAALLPHAGPREAFDVMERLRSAISAETFQVDGGGFGVTASVGVSTSRRGSDLDGLLREADAALYAAKSQGRDRTVLAQSPAPSAEPRHSRVFKGGRILFNRRSSSLDCTVRFLSERGAGVDVSSAIGLPDQFELSIEADRFVRTCRLVRFTDRHVEVEFV